MNDDQESGLLLYLDLAESNENFKLALIFKWRIATAQMCGNEFAWPKITDSYGLKQDLITLEMA